MHFQSTEQPKTKSSIPQHIITPFIQAPSSTFIDIISVFYRHTLRHMIDLVHSNESRGELEHVVSQGDDDELSILRSLLDITGNNRDLPLLVLKITNWQRWELTFLKSNAASISSMTYSGVGL